MAIQHRQDTLLLDALSPNAHDSLKKPDPRDVVTIAGKTELRFGAEEYSATLVTKAVSRGFFNRTSIR